jgi:hypothetical protein
MPLLTNELLSCLRFFGPLQESEVVEKLNSREGNKFSNGDVRVLLNTLKEVGQVAVSEIDGKRYYKVK